MFKVNYILDLLSGRLTEMGYEHIVHTIGDMANHFHWPKTIILSDSHNDEWQSEDIKELTQAFFEWALSKGKFKYLYKLPANYLSYYFGQILVSYVADRIKIIQEERGLSHRKCSEIVKSLCKEHFYTREQNDTIYVSITENADNLSAPSESIKYLGPYYINDTYTLKIQIKIIVEDILNLCEGALSIEQLSDLVYSLIQQHEEKEINETTTDNLFEYEEEHKEAVERIIENVDKIEAQMILDYLFQEQGQISLSEMEKKYAIPKSTIHHRMELFRMKIAENYIPENEEDGILFIKKIASKLDELAK